MTKNIRVCVIDDDVFVRDALALGLRDAGYQVFLAPGAAAGMDLVDREKLDAIVTDMNMPGTHGSQLIIQARANWPSMPIVAISGAAEIDGRPVADVARLLGADAALIKPFRARELIDVLQRLIS